jgi:hypothetical protein
MTWGETKFTQAKFYHATFDEGRCFALTSIELLDASLFSPRGLPSRKFDFTRSVFVYFHTSRDLISFSRSI